MRTSEPMGTSPLPSHSKKKVKTHEENSMVTLNSVEKREGKEEVLWVSKLKFSCKPC